MSIDWNAIGAIGTCTGSLATFGAVIVALWQTKWEARKKIKLDFNYHFLLDTTGQLPTQNMVALRVMNDGNRNVTIEEWGFELKDGSHLTAFPNAVIVGDKLPTLIEPDKSIQLLMPIDGLVNSLIQTIKENKIRAKDKLVIYARDNFSKYYKFKTSTVVKKVIDDNTKMKVK